MNCILAENMLIVIAFNSLLFHRLCPIDDSHVVHINKPALFFVPKA